MKLDILQIVLIVFSSMFIGFSIGFYIERKSQDSELEEIKQRINKLAHEAENKFYEAKNKLDEQINSLKIKK